MFLQVAQMKPFIPTKKFQDAVADALRTKRVFERLARDAAIILERVARGGGETHWFVCKSAADLDAIVRRLRPGSALTFYFDNRLRIESAGDSLSTRIAEEFHRHRNCVVGLVSDGELEVAVEFLETPEELQECVRSMQVGTNVFYGAFPRWDDDYDNAITVYLPDEDGITRRHPH